MVLLCIQAILLLAALSGIDYDSRRPQPTSRASPFALAAPTDGVDYDVTACGLDAVIYVECDNDFLISRKIRARKDRGTGGIVYIDDTFDSVERLSELYTPLRPSQTVAVDLETLSDCSVELKDFLEKMR